MIRTATMDDSDAILKLVNHNAQKGLMLAKSPYAIYLNIPTFFVWEENGEILGCGRLNIVWNDLAEVASLAVQESARGKGIGKALVQACIQKAKELKLKQLFT